MEITNTYFRNLYDTASAYYDAKAERNKQREAMKQADDWDGVKAFDEREDKEFPRPYTSGQDKAFRAYRNNVEKGSKGFFEVSDLPWDYEMQDFISALRDAGITTILITDQSTALMRSLFQMQKLGCCMGCLRICKRTESLWGKEEEVEVKGIEMEIM